MFCCTFFLYKSFFKNPGITSCKHYIPHKHSLSKILLQASFWKPAQPDTNSTKRSSRISFGKSHRLISFLTSISVWNKIFLC